MTNSKVAIRYASSFLDSAIENDVVDKVSDDFELIFNSIVGSKELKNAITSPIIKNETKRNIFNEIFGSKIGKDAISYLNFVVSKGRENILSEILERFFYLRDEHFNIANVEVTTAFDLTLDQKNQLQKIFVSFLNKKVKLTYSIDGKIIGGFIAKVGDTVYNASILHQLGLLKNQFLQGSASLN
jgi:F-type H+-transporting ATPase subunit delta